MGAGPGQAKAKGYVREMRDEMRMLQVTPHTYCTALYIHQLIFQLIKEEEEEEEEEEATRSLMMMMAVSDQVG